MSLPDQLADLLRPEAFPDPCDAVEMVETHISWVLLAGEAAYKLKKPVRFSFADFSTLALREHFCREELRCNRRFAPALYLDVVPVGRGPEGRLRVGEQRGLVEWAVKMRRFPAEAQLDRRLANGAVEAGALEAFGRDLAARHAALPTQTLAPEALGPRILDPALANFGDLEPLAWLEPHRPLLEAARDGTHAQAARHHDLLCRRLQQGAIRECHGDLHLSNLVMLDGQVTAFDCLEFDPALRWIDPQSDAAFLFMDCLVRQRADLGYAFMDGYLDGSADYEGAELLTFYAAYRSMVRAKVAALRRQQAEGDEREALERRCVEHLRWAATRFQRPPGRLVLMCGVSGSGKSYLAQRLAPRLPALRLRSDVARRTVAGNGPGPAGVGGGRYAPGQVEAVYAHLAAIIRALLCDGENVVVDATFLEAHRRQAFLRLARSLGSRAVTVHCDAPRAVLESRVRERHTAGDDASEAGPAVLAHQLECFVPPEGDVVRVDTGEPLSEPALGTLAARVGGQPAP